MLQARFFRLDRKLRDIYPGYGARKIRVWLTQEPCWLHLRDFGDRSTLVLVRMGPSANVETAATGDGERLPSCRFTGRGLLGPSDLSYGMNVPGPW